MGALRNIPGYSGFDSGAGLCQFVGNAASHKPQAMATRNSFHVQPLTHKRDEGNAMSKEVISTSNAPGAVGPYSQGIKIGNLFFISGQTPIDPAVGKLVEGDVAAQAEQACKNVFAVLESQGLTAANVVKTTVFITDMSTFALVNEVYKKYFTAPYPARSCVEVSKLPVGAQVEIEAIASL